MNLHAIYQKPIDRPIDGVIKADDKTTLINELEEYILTKEVAQRLSHFLDAYNNYNNANGVWISGFFGSGKSHLLKNLSLLLENKLIEDRYAIDIFLPKCEDEILKAEIKKAISIPSQSILFNIDQKADVISKTEIDALLSVFVKVFDDMCGYYGKQGHIAKFERDLDSRNQYHLFKNTFLRISGKDWEKGREQVILENSNIAKAYAEVMGGSSDDYKDIISKYRSDYKVSIEDFATSVWDYIKTKEKGFRLNFFVDEVGQYIAENIKLMTNLQTIAESLATKCKGQAWVIVTAQEDMSNVIGEMNKKQGNDFSKIQARFSNRMKLTSQDVSEVIQRRLLDKTEDAKKELSKIYATYSNNFKTMFDFVDGSRTYSNFKGEDHFINCYPFIPYQFTLFQSAIENLSEHNAFEGRHSSVGERSMLGVFQDVAKSMSHKDMGELATFDMMFDGIGNALKSQIQKSISKAKNHLPSEYALRVLKALFLVKYVKEFKPTLRNICILMQENIEGNNHTLATKIEEALNLLENQTYIRRNGIHYEFLTDEEKDIEDEIKATEVDPEAEADELTRIIFDEILKENKIKYDINGQVYSFAKKLDDTLRGRDQELSIHIISPNDARSGNLDILRGHNIGRDELMVIMDSDRRLLRDIELYNKTEKYIRQNTRTAQQPSVTRILQEKREQNNARKDDIVKSVKELLSRASLMIQGNIFETSISDAQLRIISGFQRLVTMVYPQLKMLRDNNYTENDIHSFLNPANSLFSEDAMQMDETEMEIYGYISSQSKLGVRVTLKTLIDHFSKKPYGWSNPAIQCTVAKLNTRGKIECVSDSNILERTELEKAIRNTATQANLILKPQQEFTPAQIRKTKEFYEEFFNKTLPSNEAKTVGNAIAEKIREKIHELDKELSKQTDFPFVKALEPIIAYLKSLLGKSYSDYILQVAEYSDILLDYKENIIVPIDNFMRNEQKNIYTDIKNFLRNHTHDFRYVNGTTAQDIETILNADDCYKGDKIRTARTLYETLVTKLDTYLQKMRLDKNDLLDNLKTKLMNADQYHQASDDKKRHIEQAFSDIKNQIENLYSIPVIDSYYNRFETEIYPALLQELETPIQPKPQVALEIRENSVPLAVVKAVPQLPIISAKQVRIAYDRPLLISEADVDEYINHYKNALMEQIKNGKKVQV